MCRIYLLVLACNDEQIDGEIFNAGYENHTVNELANMVRESVGTHVEIEKHSTDDNRSYHVSSEKIRLRLGFIPEKTIQDAIDDLVCTSNLEIYQTHYLPPVFQHKDDARTENKLS